ncbi:MULTISPECIES: nitroreductase family protein [Peribacillus]|jgi:nitroreductase|uniref:Nitroreductase family protein n=1 Tax=Peribacillus castrilensis TaxID=2897690 RepID=A0AAW9NIY9_9BACI|nr:MULTISPECIES: nitroreductase family protein [Peribacillus]KOR78321.1 NAD(P)H nitroreductase [Bacillus sp. FJAT-21352]MEC0276746.1 nitroreductase family protein [Peribacillus castrilensis]PEF41528.1 nitroreductase family protein [Bacillus sp. AFS094228]AZV60360.1 nitroreductase family protein [Peribacillus frigoritolerans]MCY9140442.1 nitroreductase family protein [Peribacillus frigoritolerans]
MTTTAQLTNDFKEIVTGRRSIKNYDKSVKISREEMEKILTLATLAPSSVNMQPWRFLVIDSPEGKATLAPLARFNQNQVETSSAVIAVFGDMNNFDNAEEIYGKAVDLGLMPLEVKENILASFAGYFEKITREEMKEVVLVDGGLVSMQLMLAARAYGYDTNPIGGYEKDQIAEAFGLEKDRYVPVMLISIGKAADNGHQSVRLPIDKVAQWK